MSDLVNRAKEFATISHRFQVRKCRNEPYINHPERVAARVALLPAVSEEQIAAAWLHDVVEDTACPLSRILKMFGPTVTTMVEGLTDKFTHQDYPEFNRKERKKHEHNRMAGLPAEILNIKLADIVDNLRDTPPSDAFHKVFVREVSELLAALLVTGKFNELDQHLLAEIADTQRCNGENE